MEDIYRLKSELRNKDQLIESFVSIAVAQAKHISYLRSSSLAFTLLLGVTGGLGFRGQPSMLGLAARWHHTGLLEVPAADIRHSSEREHAAPGTTTTDAAVLGRRQIIWRSPGERGFRPR